MRIDIWSDIACPWCFIGKRRLERALAAALGDDLDTDPAAWAGAAPAPGDPAPPPGTIALAADVDAPAADPRAQPVVRELAADAGLGEQPVGVAIRPSSDWPSWPITSVRDPSASSSG